MKELWNERFSSDEYVYGKFPNSFFKSFIDTEAEPGSICLAAEGEGRNGVYAALKGWKVYAIDHSEYARDKALRFAHENNVEIIYETADLNQWKANSQVDVVASIFAHFSPKEREPIHRKFIDMLRPGGKIVLEAFSKKQLYFESGGPKDYDWLYSTAMLKKDFGSLKIDSIHERTVILDEGILHQGEASIIRMTAQKPE